jgi:fimbrial chaperone protein
VTNTRDDPLPLEFQAFRREVGRDGEQQLVPADDAFLIFPPQALLEPEATQAVRIQYLGDPGVRVSESYVIEVQEVPVVPDDFNGIVFAYNFGVAVYLRAAGAEEALSFSQVERDGDTLSFSVANDGSDYGFLAERTLSIRAGGERVDIRASELAEYVENPIIPPHSTRDFTITIPDLPEGDVSMSAGRVRR